MDDDEKDVLVSVVELVTDNIPAIKFFRNMIKKRDDRLIDERMKSMLQRIDNLELFQKKLEYLVNDSNKYIHIRNFLSFYFTRTDPALVETNIKIFLDYVKEKYTMDIYDTLLEKICLLNKDALNVLLKIKYNQRDDNYYDWKEFIKLYPTINQDLRYREILTEPNPNNEMLEITYGMKRLIENDFIINLSTTYNEIDIYNVDKFSLTSLGFLILNYI